MAATNRILWSFALLLLTLPMWAQKKSNNPWQDFREKEFLQAELVRQIIPTAYRTVELDVEALQNVLQQAPMRFSAAAETSNLTLQFPMPDGTMEHFKIVDAPIMHPDLAKNYPAIHAYAGRGVEDPTAYARFGLTHKGFHAMILSARHSTVFIDAYALGDDTHYISYYKKDYGKRAEDDFSCQVESMTKGDVILDDVAKSIFTAGGDCQFRVYELALACTAEYATFHGGTVPDVMDAFNVAMARVNGIYERDFALTMELVPGNDQLIYLSNPDPYTNNSGGTMLNENQNTIDDVIGFNNYDIGHVFSTGGGGIAQLNAPCGGGKARGVTGLGSPINDPFYVDYVAHEMGHQYGANHTQNNSCNRNNATAMEPGSASTIMGYAGICSPNVQNNSDDYFHAISMDEIYNNIVFGSGSNCPSVTDMDNTAPEVSLPSTSYNVPVSTPFALTATATDAEGDVLTYCWEQMDNEVATMPPVSTNTDGPAFRSLDPNESPTRYFPSIDNVVNNSNDTWEVLPSVTRNMNFRVTVRDNHDMEGCTDEIDLSLNFTANTGPFVVTNPNTNVTWMVGENQEVTWDVANTDAAPVNCEEVDIYLSIDGGNTYPILLAENVPNDGTHMISVPNNVTSTARVMVFCAGNVFFDISNQNFTIEEPAVPTFVMNASPESIALCNDSDATYTVELTGLAGFTEPTTLTASGLPTGAIATFSPNPVTPSGNTTMIISNLGSAVAGTYTITIDANSATINNSTTVEMVLAAGIPEISGLDTPIDGATEVDALPTLSWATAAGAASYTVEIATSPAFGASIIETGMSSTNNYTLLNSLDPLGIYYWRVRASSDCGDGDNTSAYAFQTAGIGCTTYNSTDVPAEISPDFGGDVFSTLDIPANATISSITMSIDIAHTYTGDLSGDLTSPAGTMISLFDAPGIPASNFGCSQDDILVTFDDNASNTAEDFENTCDPAPSISGDFQSITPLGNLIGENAMGEWTFHIFDSYEDEDGGAINAWSLNICTNIPPGETPSIITNATLPCPQAGSADATTTYLEHTTAGSATAEISYTLMTTPANGMLFLNGVALNVGDSFTQADIDNNLVSYTHDGSATATDSFQFNVLNGDNGWLYNQTFNIVIVANDLAATAELESDISCNDANDGIIVASANGGTMPYSYSIDGEEFQSENTFNGLAAGTYTVTVRDDFGFEITTNSVSISNPIAISVSADVTDNDLVVNASGGTGSLTYSIDGEMYQASNEFMDLAEGAYTVYVQDANGCIETTQAVIAIDQIIASAEVTNAVSCNDGGDGQITVTVGGGIMPYSYSINGEDFQASNIFNDVAVGTYIVTVQDANGVEVMTNSVTLDNPALINVMATNNDFDITVTTDSSDDLEYSLDGITYQASNVLTAPSNGTYTVYVQNALGCIYTTMIEIAVNTLAVTGNVINNVSCNSDSDGCIDVVVSGGTPPYTFTIDSGDNEICNLPAGEYTIIVTDAEGFTQTIDGLTITEPTPIEIATATECHSATINVAGGTEDYGITLGGNSIQNGQTVEDLANGNYDVMVMDANGCIEGSTVSIDAVEDANLSIESIACFGDENGTLTITSVNGGPTPYMYSLNNSAFQSENTFEGLGSGSYNIAIQDANGCEISNQFTIVSPAALSLGVNVLEDDIEAGGAGGTGALTYSIDGENFQTSGSFTDLPNGEYTVTVMDENGCTATETVVVMVNGLNDIEHDLFFLIQPNPSNGLFQIVMDMPTQEDIHFRVYDVTGKLVFNKVETKNASTLTTTIDVQYLPSGAYYLTATDGQLIGTKELLIIK